MTIYDSSSGKARIRFREGVNQVSFDWSGKRVATAELYRVRVRDAVTAEEQQTLDLFDIFASNVGIGRRWNQQRQAACPQNRVEIVPDLAVDTMSRIGAETGAPVEAVLVDRSEQADIAFADEVRRLLIREPPASGEPGAAAG